MRWLRVSLAWGLTLFGLLILLGRAILGGPVEDPASYFGLMVVLGLMSLVFTLLKKRE